MANRIKTFLRSPWGVALKAAFSLALLAFFFHSVDLERLGLLWGQVTWLHLVVLVVLTCGRNLLGAVRNRIVVRVIRDVPIMELVRQQFLATFFNNFLPTAIGGDGARVYYLRRCGIPADQGAMLLLIERLIGFYAMLFIALISAFTWDCPDSLRWSVIIGFAGYTVGLAWLFIVPGSGKGGTGLLQRIRGVLRRFHRRPGLLLNIGWWSLAYQGISIYISYYVAVITLGDMSILPFLTLVPLVWFFTMVPISLGGVGLRELAFIELLAVVGIAQEKALFISLGTYLALVMSGLVGGVLHLAGPGRGREET